MEKKLDMIGNPCPIPVIETKKELAKDEISIVIVTVDNIVAVQNLEKMAKGMGFEFKYDKKAEDLFDVCISKVGSGEVLNDETQCQEIIDDTEEGVTVLISSQAMGRGEDELGKILIKGFIFSLSQLPVPPKAVMFINSGVMLTSKQSNTIGDLKVLIEKGTKILSCGTCVNYYKLETPEVGEVGDMMKITEYLSSAKKLINI